MLSVMISPSINKDIGDVEENLEHKWSIILTVTVIVLILALTIYTLSHLSLENFKSFDRFVDDHEGFFFFWFYLYFVTSELAWTDTYLAHRAEYVGILGVAITTTTTTTTTTTGTTTTSTTKKTKTTTYTTK